MKFCELLGNLKIVEQYNDLDCEIKSIAYDSRKVKQGTLFVCIDGTTVDGHRYIEQAREAGAVAFLVSKRIEVPEGCAVVRVEDTRFGLAAVADAFYGHPTGRLPLIGVTGTKGKTTTTFMIKNILEAAGKKVGLIGTIQNMIGHEILYTERTTPEALDLQGLFVEMLDKGMDYAVMEVSSQGLMLHRVGCCAFQTGIFTNIESDHIGPNEHKDFEDYFSQKLKLFPMCHSAVVNGDVAQVGQVLDSCPQERLVYGTMGTDPQITKGTDPVVTMGTDLLASQVKAFPNRVEFHVKTPWWEDDITLSVPGLFNVSNALAAIGACGLAGIEKEAVKAGLAKFSVKGRTEIVSDSHGFTVMIDYAHNAMSLESLLKSVREYAPGRIVCMFGCGGNRDRSRRFEMGEVSGRFADFTIITSDNPRNEEPEAIINDIETGMLKTNGEYIKILQRRDAMKYSIENAKPGDIIIFAGKGHETYQIFSDKTIHFDEREVVAEIMAELFGEATK